MEDRKLSVTLTGPAKIDGVREPAGKSVTVTTALALQLAASGVINPDAVRDAVSVDLFDTPLENDFQEAVDAAVSAALVPLTAERDTLINTVTELKDNLLGRDMALKTALDDLQTNEGRLEEERQKIADLEKDLSAEKQARADAEAQLATAQAELEKLTKSDADPGKGDDAKPAKPTK